MKVHRNQRVVGVEPQEKGMEFHELGGSNPQKRAWISRSWGAQSQENTQKSESRGGSTTQKRHGLLAFDNFAAWEPNFFVAPSRDSKFVSKWIR